MNIGKSIHGKGQTACFQEGITSSEDTASLVSLLKRRAPFVFLDSAVSSGRDSHSLFFAEPSDIITGSSPSDVSRVFGAVEKALGSGKYVAGYFTYEWGFCMEPVLWRLLDRHSLSGPLVWLGVFDRPSEPAGPVAGEVALSSLRSEEVPAIKLECSEDEFVSGVRAVKGFIAAGDTYQVNYTLRGRFLFDHDPAALYILLRGRQPVKYGAFIFHDNRQILSFSPELFFSVDNRIITARPMKGTVRRGATRREDEANRRFLAGDMKNRAENVMIVDLIRNDLGRISETGTVTVPELFTVEPYETLYQMTSTIRGRLRASAGWEDIFRAIYPCGSITGAPKIRTMEIIAELERSPRGVYTGAIGYMAPDGSAMFNVAIRTVLLEDGRGEIGIGSGITWGSEPGDEFRETLLKAEFFSRFQERDEV